MGQALFSLYLAGPFCLTWDCRPAPSSCPLETVLLFFLSIPCHSYLNIFFFLSRYCKHCFLPVLSLSHLCSLFMTLVAAYMLMTFIKPFLNFTLIIVKTQWVSWRFLIFSMSISFQFSSVTQSCPTLCDPMDCSTPDLPVHHQLPESTQTHVLWVGDAIQPSHPLSSPSPPALSLSQHQGLFKWVSSLHQVAEFQLQL